MSHEASISPKTSVVQVTDVDQDRHGSNQFRSPSNIQPQPQTTVPQQDLINFDDTANAGRQSNLPHLPSAPDTYRTNDLAGLNHDFSAIKLDAPHDTEGQQAKPQDATAVRTIPQEQPSEIYGIRVVNWMDGIHKSLRQSPILVQNLNGPCPLLALVNSLVLRTPSDVQSPLIKALNSRERISLGLLIQTLFDELTTYVNEEHQLPDIEDLSAFLTMLHTGMNVNPRLTPVSFTARFDFRC